MVSTKFGIHNGEVNLPEILAIARAGNPSRAWTLFHASGWDERKNDPKALTLKGRLLKDRAKVAHGADQLLLYSSAADCYLAAAELQEDDSYPLINAASLALLGGDPERARTLAQKTLTLIENDPDQGENAYWRAATRSEALLLFGDEAGASKTLAEGIEELPNAWEDHAATIGQFELILLEQGKDSSWLDQHRPPDSLYFSGMIGLDENDPKTQHVIDEIVDRQKPGFGFGALAAGSDIMIAEALCNIGAELHVTLPYSVDHFRGISVQPFGQHWVPRFNALIENAATVYSLPEIPSAEERVLDDAVDVANLVAMGQSIRNAGLLRSKAKAVSIVAIGEETGRQFPMWASSGHQYLMIEAARKTNMKNNIDEKLLDNSQLLCAMLYLENIDGEMLAKQLSQDVIFEKVAGGHTYVSTDLENVSAIAKSLTKNSDGLRSSLIIDTMNKSDPARTILDQAADMARASKGGVTLTDYKSAMALTLLSTGNSIQEIGELQTAYGAIPLWSIS